MPEPTSSKHYEDQFEFPLWKLIKRHAEEKDISYLAASEQVVPEYVKSIRYRDAEFENRHIQKRLTELRKLDQAETGGK